MPMSLIVGALSTPGAIVIAASGLGVFLGALYFIAQVQGARIAEARNDFSDRIKDARDDFGDRVGALDSHIGERLTEQATRLEQQITGVGDRLEQQADAAANRLDSSIRETHAELGGKIETLSARLE